MTEQEVKDKIKEYLDIFEPDSADTLADIADFIGIDPNIVSWTAAITAFGTGNLIYSAIDSLREMSYNAFSNGGKINK